MLCGFLQQVHRGPYPRLDARRRAAADRLGDQVSHLRVRLGRPR